MRRVTRNLVVGLAVLGVLLLALGALPSYLRSGDPYYLAATEVPEYEGPTVDAADLSERRFPYTTEALSDGRSSAYYEGPTGFKEAFTHSPFDELNELDQRDRDEAGRDGGAVNGTTAHVTRDGTVYRVRLVGGTR
ncbi:hypothetical protein ACFQPA_13020 [Halomarina halobia]|uniref:Uncharacterized protein n=1 Tax=Halomarina halobia TaxID=3033386 RepID=A0ABD6A8P5_9EURY|nr:hypothetical protein [Halomarina sp. PSR21]